MKSLFIFLLLSGLPQSHDTVESVRRQFVDEFSKDPAGQVEVFYVGGNGCVSCQGIYTLGIMQAATETGHPVLFRTSGSSADEPQYVLKEK